MTLPGRGSLRNANGQCFYSEFPAFKVVLVVLIVGLSIPANVNSQSLQWGLNFRAFNNLAMCLDTSGNVIVGGSFTGDVDFDPGPGTFMMNNAYTQDGYISSFDPSGNFLWADQISGSSYQQVNDLMGDSVGNLYACGNSHFNQGLVQKRYPNQFVQWSKTFFTPSSSNSFYIQCMDMAQDQAGYLYVTGYHRNNTTFSSIPFIQLYSASETMFIAKMDTLGNVIWVKQTDTPTDYDDCIGHSIAADSFGNVFVYGYFRGDVDFDPDTSSAYILTSPGSSSGNTFLLKLDSAGNFNWIIDFPRVGSFSEKNEMVLSDDMILISDHFASTIDFDPGPGVQTIPGMSNGAFILKLDTLRNFYWVKGIEGQCVPRSLSTDAIDNVYVSGWFGDSGPNIDFDPGPGTAIDSSLGGRDGFVLKLNQAGQYIWHGTLGGNYWANECHQVRVDSAGSAFVAGTFNGDQDLDPFSNVLTVSDTTLNAFLIKIGQCGYTSQTIPISGCDTAWFNGLPFTNPGPHFLTYLDTAGCDSTIIIDVDVWQSYYQQYSLSGCDSVVAGNVVYTQSGNYVSNYLTVNGCDSIVAYYVTVNYSNDTALFYAGCDSVVVNNQAYYSSQQINQLLSTSNGCDSIVALNINVTDLDTSVVLNGITLVSLDTVGAFQWVDCANGFIPIAGAVLPAFTPTVNGNYAVILSQSGCIDTSACHDVIGVWISETGNETSFELYPNPASGQITVSQSGIVHDKTTSVLITDLSGKILSVSPWKNPDPLTIDINKFASGIYLLKIINETQTLVTRFEVVK